MILKQWLLRWHKTLGACLAFVFVLLAVTGILLNHSHGLKLDHARVPWGWLNRYYGVQTQLQGYELMGGWAFAANEYLVFNGLQVGDCVAPLVGVVALNSMGYGLCANGLLLFNDQAQLVELASGPEAGVSQLGVKQQRLVAKSKDTLFTLDEFNMQWLASSEDSTPSWAELKPVPAAISGALPSRLQHAVTWERVVQDIHSGRFFGAIGVWLVDIVALGLVFSALSGWWLWFNKRKPHRRDRRQLSK